MAKNTHVYVMKTEWYGEYQMNTKNRSLLNVVIVCRFQISQLIKAMKVFKIDIPIYYGYLRIIICEDFVKAAKKLNIDDEGDDLSIFGAFVCTSYDEYKNPHYNVFMESDIEVDLIAHEVVHLVAQIFESRHISLNLQNDDEPFAYMTGWVTKEIYKALKKK